MKKTLALIALSIAVYLGLTGWTGVATQSALSKANALLDGEKVPFLRVADRTYKKSFFSAEEQFTLEITLDALDKLKAKPGAFQAANFQKIQAGALEDEAEVEPESEQQIAPRRVAPLRIVIRNHITHGPLPGFSSFGLSRIRTELVFGDELSAELQKIVGRDNPVEIVTVIGYTGGGTTSITSPAFKTAVGSTGLELDWGGLESQFSYGRRLSSIDGKFTAPGLKMTEPSGSVLHIGAIQLNADLEKVFEDLYAGTTSVLVSSIDFTGKQASDSVRLEAIAYDIDMSRQDDFMNMGVKFGIAKFKFQKIDLQNVTYNLSVNHLHGPTYAMLSRRLSELYWNSLSGNSATAVLAVGGLAEYGSTLLEYSPEFVIDRLGVTTSEGGLTITGRAKVDNFKRTDLDATGGFVALLEKVEATADVSFDAALFRQLLSVSAPSGDRTEQSQAQLAQMESMGLLKREGEKFVGHFEMRKGKMFANGKPMN
ncbi:MAG: YdgA family protein [Candidatus Obscuribacterales bacterium]|nr:YdgA family protein [Steroidobacteraceae bacterium]